MVSSSWGLTNYHCIDVQNKTSVEYDFNCQGEPVPSIFINQSSLSQHTCFIAVSTILVPSRTAVLVPHPYSWPYLCSHYPGMLAGLRVKFHRKFPIIVTRYGLPSGTESHAVLRSVSHYTSCCLTLYFILSHIQGPSFFHHVPLLYIAFHHTSEAHSSLIFLL